MNDLHICIANFPHFAHVMPTIPIVSVLVRRGYRVTYVTSKRFSSAIGEVGGEVILAPDFHVQSLFESEVSQLGFEASPIYKWGLRTLEVIQGLVENDPPDLIIYDFLALAGRIMADRSAIPAIQTSPTFLHNLHTWGDDLIDPQFRQAILEGDKIVDAALEPFGISPGNFRSHSNRLNIFLFPSAFQPNRELFDERYFFAGRCPAETTYRGVGQISHRRGRRTAFISTSTTYIRGAEYFRMCMDALSDLDLHIVMLIRQPRHISELGVLPPNVEIVQDASHSQILPHCSLMICHGGIITPAEAAYHGVPLVMTSHGMQELELQADILANLGMGIHLRVADTNPKSIRQAALLLLEDPAVAEKVRLLRHSVRREPGAEETANKIEDYLDQKRGMAAIRARNALCNAIEQEEGA